MGESPPARARLKSWDRSEERMKRHKRIGSSLDEMLAEDGSLADPANESVTLRTMARAAKVLGKRLRLELA